MGMRYEVDDIADCFFFPALVSLRLSLNDVDLMIACYNLCSGD